MARVTVVTVFLPLAPTGTRSLVAVRVTVRMPLFFLALATVTLPPGSFRVPSSASSSSQSSFEARHLATSRPLAAR